MSEEREDGERGEREGQALSVRKAVLFFLQFCFKTVFATESPMMRTFDEKNLGKRPPPFAYTPSKNLGRRVDRA